MPLPFRLIVFTALVASGAIAVSSCAKKSGSDPLTEAPLVLTAVVEEEGGAERVFTGVVTARTQSDLGFRIAGKVTQRLVDVGQSVQEGQPLMRLDLNDLALAVDARVAEVEAARARSVQAVADEARLRNLVKAGAVSPQAYDQAKAAADSAKAQLSAAEAQARVARNSNEYAVLVADADGVVVSTLAEPGQVVGAGQIVVRLARAGPREAAINLPETLRPALDSAAEASLYGGNGEYFPARLRQLSDAADPGTRTFDARYVLEGAAASAPLGVTVKIRLGGESGIVETTVPLGAIHNPGTSPGVWVLNSNASSVSFRPVQIAQFGEEMVKISKGLNPGERVVALGAHLVHEGQRVRVADGKGTAQ